MRCSYSELLATFSPLLVLPGTSTQLRIDVEIAEMQNNKPIEMEGNLDIQ